MKEKVQSLFDIYLAKAKDLMEYKALITLPYYLIKNDPKLIKDVNVVIDYTLFSPIPVAPIKIDMNNFDSKFKELENKYLSESCIEKLVSIYEMFLFDLMKETYIQYPMKLSANKQIKISQVLNTANKEELLYVIISKELDEIKYQSMENWHNKLCELLAITEINPSLTSALIEVKSTRDIIVHNSGQINEIYIYKTGGNARGKVGEHVDCTADYFKNAWSVVVTAMDEIRNKVVTKYS